jgi:hypothetical protein
MIQAFQALAANRAQGQSSLVKTHEQADGGGKALHKKSVASILTHRKKEEFTRSSSSSSSVAK